MAPAARALQQRPAPLLILNLHHELQRRCPERGPPQISSFPSFPWCKRFRALCLRKPSVLRRVCLLLRFRILLFQLQKPFVVSLIKTKSNIYAIFPVSLFPEVAQGLFGFCQSHFARQSQDSTHHSYWSQMRYNPRRLLMSHEILSAKTPFYKSAPRLRMGKHPASRHPHKNHKTTS